MTHSNLKAPAKVSTPAQIATRRAFAASRRIPNAPDPQRAKRIHAWAEFVKAAMGRDEGRKDEG